MGIRWLSKAGQGLPIRVLYLGKPLPGAEVEGSDHRKVATTDRDGAATVPLAQGNNVIKVEYKSPIKDDPDADMKYLSNLHGMHHPEREKPFGVVYNMFSITRGWPKTLRMGSARDRQVDRKAPPEKNR
jgi:NADH:ubiquinone oxidoreductase subunit C